MDWTAAVFDPAPVSAFIIENDLAPSPSYSCDPPNPAKPHTFTQDKSSNHQQLEHPPTASSTTTPEREPRSITTRSPSPVLSIPGSWATEPARATISAAAPLPPPSRPRSTMAAAETAAATATAAPAPPPFDVPRPWQHAMSMVSINAGLTPQFLLHAYYHAVARGPRPSFYQHHQDYHSHNHSYHNAHHNQQQQQQQQQHSGPPQHWQHYPHPSHRGQPAPLPDRGWVHLDLTDHRNLHPSQATHARRARARGIRGVRIGYAGGDPGRVYVLAVAIDEVDPATGHGVVRFVTNTSVRHVLGGDDEAGDGNGGRGRGTGRTTGLGMASCADCPLWLPVRLVDPGAVVPLSGAPGAGAGAGAAAAAGPEAIPAGTATTQTRSDGGRPQGDNTDTESSPYQIIPCCDDWLDAMDFTRPLSAEEKQASGVVDRLIREVQRMRLALLAREREVRHRDGEVASPRRGGSVGRGHGWCERGHEMDREGVGDGVPVAVTPLRTWASDVDAVGQYWWAVIVVLVLILAIIYK